MQSIFGFCKGQLEDIKNILLVGNGRGSTSLIAINMTNDKLANKAFLDNHRNCCRY